MVYLITGLVIALIGFGIMNVQTIGEVKLLGVITFIVGGVVMLKGRRELDKHKSK